ncbi:MOB kinase activator-like 2 [Aplysia californica]|uniref:MOB kinase activator-like 2 n=2 Tax=Aplysia californica TaxID=6500 RepID=A0ABM0K9L0_APLCA|nr:MOB kinase activator-like 2 [Aplysia californica]
MCVCLPPRGSRMDSINFYFKSEGKKESGVRYLLQSIYMFQSKIWKGRRKDKECPTPPGGEESKEYLQDHNAKDRISDADFFKLVALPPSSDLNEWLATHTISFFNHVNLVYGVVSEFCTAETCPAMSAPDNVQYFWTDDKGKKSKNTAPQYVDYVMTHIQKLINDESVFPTKFGHTFPADLDVTVKRIHRYLFHVLAHLYHAHYPLLRQLGLHAHLNTLFTHFMVFTSKFDLVQDKESDLLLHLFSLLLKNLADPSQNPKLREGLGLGPPEDSEKKSAPASSTAQDAPGQETNMDTSGDSRIPLSMELSCDVSSPSSLPSTQIPNNATATTNKSTTPSSSSSPPCHGTATEGRISNGGTSLPPSHPVCDNTNDLVPAKDAAAKDSSHRQTDPGSLYSSNGLQKNPPSSSSPPPGNNTTSFISSSPSVVDTEPTSSSPSEWLANLQVSAT